MPRDASVQVIVSLGPAPRPVPNVQGRPHAEAVQILEAAGFQIAGTSGSTNTRVFATDPRAGSEQPYGTKVTLYMTLN